MYQSTGIWRPADPVLYLNLTSHSAARAVFVCVPISTGRPSWFSGCKICLKRLGSKQPQLLSHLFHHHNPLSTSACLTVSFILIALKKYDCRIDHVDSSLAIGRIAMITSKQQVTRQLTAKGGSTIVRVYLRGHIKEDGGYLNYLRKLFFIFFLHNQLGTNEQECEVWFVRFQAMQQVRWPSDHKCPFLDNCCKQLLQVGSIRLIGFCAYFVFINIGQTFEWKR